MESDTCFRMWFQGYTNADIILPNSGWFDSLTEKRKGEASAVFPRIAVPPGVDR